MNKSFFNPEECPCIMERDVLSAFKQHQQKPSQIQPGMTPSEIADFVSDHMIGMIKDQFENARQKYLTNTK